MTRPDTRGAILRFLADMVKEPEVVVDMGKHGPVVTAHPPLLQFFVGLPTSTSAEHRRVLDSPRVKQMVARDRLHPNEPLLRVGWGWVVGPAMIDGRERRVLTPLVSRPITRSRLTGLVPDAGWRTDGDLEGSHLITNPLVRASLADDAQYGGGSELAPGMSDLWWNRFPRLRRWMADTADAMGFGEAGIAPPVVSLEDARSGPRLLVVPNCGLYLSRDLQQVGRRPSLESWAARSSRESTALDALYRSDEGDEASTADRDTTFVSAILPLDADQQRAVLRSRHAPVSVVSGPPGTGKSHTVAAIAVDAVHRGERVLIATQSQHAASVVIDFLVENDAPTPVVFGDNRSRELLVTDLYETIGNRDADVRATRERLDEAVRARALTRHRLGATLEAESLLSADDPVSRVLDRTIDDAGWGRIEADLATVDGPGSRWSWSRHRALKRLEGVAHGRNVDALRVRLEARRLARSGGLTLSSAIEEQIALEREVRLRFLALVRAQANERLGRASRAAVVGLGRALRAGRATRRDMLAELDGDALLKALPLWVGTIGDIDDLLPPTAAMFDLVIVDEASQVDQTVSPPALLRARRLVAAGDPRQLRHTSFTADTAIADGLRVHGLDGSPIAPLLDVRRNSLLDVASAAGETSLLTTHYRSVPHIIDFSARRFYEGRVAPATRHPGVDTSDRIDVVHIDGSRHENGSNLAEAQAVVDLVARLVDRGDRGIGVITPFRAHADLIENLLVESLDADIIDDHRIVSGTVHAFQGAEREHVIVSLALDDSSAAGSFRFAQDARLFNVMVTRARDRCTVVTSLLDPPAGTIRDYLDHAEKPGLSVRDRPVMGWAAVIGELLADQGLVVRGGYPVGHERLDLVVGDDGDAFALDCQVHPDGVEAHIRRRILLDSLGWQVIDGFESRWADRAGEFAIRLGRGELGSR